MIVDRLNDWARKTPGKAAIAHNGLEFSYLQLAQLIEATRRHLSGLGLLSGTVAIIVIHNLLDAWVALLAARANGLTTIVVQSLQQAADLDLRNVSCVMTTATELAHHDLVQNEVSGARLVVIPAGIYQPASLQRISEFTPPDEKPGSHICLTSGSTGTPKKCLVPGDNDELFARGDPSSALFNDRSRVFLHSLVLSSKAAYKRSMTVWHANGCVLMDQRGWATALKTLVFTDLSYLTPHELLQFKPAAEAIDFRPAHKVTIHLGGGFFNWSVIAPLRERSLQFVLRFSATEIFDSICITGIEDKEDLLWHRPTGYRKIEIVDDFGNEVPAGTEGQLRIPSMSGDTQEYMDDPVASAAAFQHGCFYTGDMAIQRADGCIKIIGRYANVLVIGGSKCPAEPIEADVRTKLGVPDLCLFARQNGDTEDELFVVFEGDTLPAREKLELIQQEFFMFQKIHFWPVGTFPRNAGGKVYRLALRKHVYANTDAQRR